MLAGKRKVTKLCFAIVAIGVLIPNVICQRTGDWTEEVHPKLTTWRCTVKDGCKARDTRVVLDQKFRYLHVRGRRESCKNNDNTVNSIYCIDSEMCYNNCVYEGANYTDEGVTTANSGGLDSSITLKIITDHDKFVNPRVYLLDETERQYEKIVLGPNTEFTYDVDLSLNHCRVKGNVYLVQMDWDGGKNDYFEGGAFMGGGYCDGQCLTRDISNGLVNTNKSGACCAELDLYEGNRETFSFASHPCKYDGFYYACDGVDCKHSLDGGLCSQRDCSFYDAKGLDPTFWGSGKTIDTSRKVTVVTQFLTQEDYSKIIAPGYDISSNSQTDLVAMRRYYLQDGKFFSHGILNGKNTTMEITDKTCWTKAMSLAGGMANSGRYMQRGMVLTFSMYPGYSAKMWLYDTYSYGCKTISYQGKITPEMVDEHRKTSMTVSNVRWGELGSTFKTDGSSWL